MCRSLRHREIVGETKYSKIKMDELGILRGWQGREIQELVLLELDGGSGKGSGGNSRKISRQVKREIDVIKEGGVGKDGREVEFRV